MKHGVEHIQIRVAHLKHFHILVKHCLDTVAVRCSRCSGVTVTELHDHFIERFLSSSTNDVCVVIVDLAALLFLFCVVLPQRLSEKLVVGIFNVLLLVCDIRCKARLIHILRSEFPVVVLNVRAVLCHSLAQRKADAQILHSLILSLFNA